MTDAGLKLIDAPSPNFDERGLAPGRGPDLIVLHYTGMADGAAALAKLLDPDPKMGVYAQSIPERFRGDDPDASLGKASAHYLVEEDGRIFRLVKEDRRAWHAGAAFWAGDSEINARAIGVEIVNGGHDYGLPSYPPAQIDALIALLKDICARRDIPPANVIGHSDVAPDRKEDPGEHFPWDRLEEAGLAQRLTASPEGRGERIAAAGDAGKAVRQVQEQLIAIGYGLAASGGMDERTVAVITAFQRRHRRERVDGVLDHETAELIEAAYERLGGG